MIKCSRCKKEKDDIEFINGSKVLKECQECRLKKKIAIKAWKDKNKERISEYNKIVNSKEKVVKTILLRKKNTEEEYQKFFSLQECCDTLHLQKPNLHKMLNGKLKSTGGYEGKYGEIETVLPKVTKSWDEVKEEKNYNNKIVSSKRVLHMEKEGEMGKKCCHCQEWQPLTQYNKSGSHWDKLRNDCKICLVKYRKTNRKKISAHYLEYERERKKIDPEFKLLKTLRSRLNSAIKCKQATKSKSTLELTGCSLEYLKGHLEAKFEPGMTWDNHGKWHIDHIRPCCSFNLLEESEQMKCFHYKNLQPLWGQDNLIKGGLFI